MVRIKHRYLTLHILTPDHTSLPPPSTTSPLPKPTQQVQFHYPLALLPFPLLNHLKAQISHLYGAPTLALLSTSLKILYLSPATATAIVRVAREYYRILWAAITFMTSLPEVTSTGGEGAGRIRGGREEGKGTGVVIRVVRVSGTIRIAEREVVKRAKGAIARARLEGGVEGFLERFEGVEGVGLDEAMVGMDADAEGEYGGEDDGSESSKDQVNG